jgi:anti-sigma regulatory factor (Ser/Thr protein kinase)
MSTAQAGSAVTGARIRTSYLELGAHPGAVPCARLYTRHVLREWGLAHVADDAELLVSELVTNAVKATMQARLAAQVAVYLAADPDRLIFLVWDASPEAPARRPHGDDAMSGRGLEIVEALSENWGSCVREDGGKVVWARLSTARW